MVFRLIFDPRKQMSYDFFHRIFNRGAKLFEDQFVASFRNEPKSSVQHSKA
ncbi:hypothetical protein HanPSC8_Chr14g0613951 [Helianthus annuus]|nr:hypothetical protein HanPSC8_Chr14g0613951 [Helianthus annuus]